MVLNDRKIKILEAIINDYIMTAEPIGSRTIAKKYDLGISSATIRNEMSDLEDMGLIIQPHTSSGRVPSDRGYRLYVDQMLQFRELTQEETQFLQQMIDSNLNQIDYLMKETAKAIALLTNYTTIVSEPQVKKNRVKHLQLVPLDENTVVLVLVMDSKVVKNITVHMPGAPGYEELNQLSFLLNQHLPGLSLDEIGTGLGNSVNEENPALAPFVEPVLRAVQDAIETEDHVQIYTSGAKNILGFPEFNDIEKAKGIFQALEEKKMLITLLGQDNGGHIEIRIGSENDMEEMKDCSVIKANYTVGNGTYGNIGIIGPTRMNYSQVVSILNGIVKNINTALRQLGGG